MRYIGVHDIRKGFAYSRGLHHADLVSIRTRANNSTSTRACKTPDPGGTHRNRTALHLLLLVDERVRPRFRHVHALHPPHCHHVSLRLFPLLWTGAKETHNTTQHTTNVSPLQNCKQRFNQRTEHLDFVRKIS